MVAVVVGGRMLIFREPGEGEGAGRARGAQCVSVAGGLLVRGWCLAARGTRMGRECGAFESRALASQ